MTGPTPGPWTYKIVPDSDEERQNPHSEWSGLFIGPLDEENGSIHHTIFEGGFTHGPEDGDPEEDAALMAAAPKTAAELERVRKSNAELLEALTEMLESHSLAGNIGPEPSKRRLLAKRKAREVISRALPLEGPASSHDGGESDDG